MVYTKIKIEKFMRVTGKITNRREKVCFVLQMETFTRVDLKMVNVLGQE
jgi:hypothetical protein